jgi:hypothetical protein
MERVIARYLDRVTAPGRTRHRHNNLGRLRTFTAWLGRHHPEITNFAQLTRTHLEAFMTWLKTDYRHYRTGESVSITTQIQTVSVLNVFFRSTPAWGWDHVPRPGVDQPPGHPQEDRESTPLPPPT